MLIDALGYVAAGAVLATFSVRSIKTLRALAILSNVLFIAYAIGANLPPVLLLHALLLPLNALRLYEVMNGHAQSQDQNFTAATRHTIIKAPRTEATQQTEPRFLSVVANNFEDVPIADAVTSFRAHELTHRPIHPIRKHKSFNER
jgi:hypothetical protein